MRQRIQAPEGAPAESPKPAPEIKPFLKCECGPNAPYPEVLAKTGGRCPECLRGVHVGLPDLATDDPSYAKIVGLRRPRQVPMTGPITTTTTTQVPAMIAGVAISPPLPEVGPGLGARLREKGMPESHVPHADAMITGAQKFLDDAVAAIDVKVHEGDEVTVKLPNERYGEKDSFSSYGVPEVHWTTRVQPGEHPLTAARRATAMARKIQDEERAVSKQRYLAHLPNAFKA